MTPRHKGVLETGPSSCRPLVLSHASRGSGRGREPQTFGRVGSQGLRLTKSGWEGSSGPGTGRDDMGLQTDQMWTDDHGGLAWVWGLSAFLHPGGLCGEPQEQVRRA